MEDDIEKLPPDSQSKPERSASWKAELNDNYCKLRRLELPPIG